MFFASGCLLSEAQEIYNQRLLFGFALDGYPITTQKLVSIERESGISPDMIVFFSAWQSPLNKSLITFPKESLESISNRGAIPCITWEPMYYENNAEIMIEYTDILDGKWDEYIINFAKSALLYRESFLLRFAHEMNIERYHWGTKKSDYNENSPHIYQQIYRYVFNKFKDNGVNNAIWVFCPNAESVPNTTYNPNAGWNTIKAYYPGDDFVDIMGIDGYNWGTTQTKDKHGWNSHWQDFTDIFKPAYTELKALAPKKPIIIFETACVRDNDDRSKWIKDSLSMANKWDIRGLIWFQVNKEVDWRLLLDKDMQEIEYIRYFTSMNRLWLWNILNE